MPWSLEEEYCLAIKAPRVQDSVENGNKSKSQEVKCAKIHYAMAVLPCCLREWPSKHKLSLSCRVEPHEGVASPNTMMKITILCC